MYSFSFIYTFCSILFAIDAVSLRSYNHINNETTNVTYTIQLNEQNNCTLNGDTIETSSKTCSYNGICLDTGYCKCDLEYATYPSNSKKQCNYMRKSRLIAILLHFFLGFEFGACEYYLGNIDLCTIQLMLCMPLICVCSMVIDVITKKTENECSSILSLFILLGMFGFWLIDLIKIVDGSRKDGHGIATYEN